MSPASPTRTPITDSPWFWAYVFATGAIIALLVGTPRYDARQKQIENQFLGRQTAGQVVGQASSAEGRSQEAELDGPASASAEPGRTHIISLRPLQLLMTLVLCGAWMVFWLQRRRSFIQRADQEPATSSSGSSSSASSSSASSSSSTSGTIG